MLSAGVLGRILPHPFTVHKMFVLTSLVSSMMVGFMISPDCCGDKLSSWLLGLSEEASSFLGALPAAEAAMFVC